MKIDILGSKIDNITMKIATNTVFTYFSMNSTHTIYTPNAEICMEAYKNKEFRKVLNKGSLVIPDGQGVILASKILKTPLKEKVAGFKLTMSLFESKKPFSCFIFASKPGITINAKNILNNKYPLVNIKGHRNGYFSETDIISIINHINECEVDILFVGLGAPKQELFIDKYKSQLNCKVIMGIGGAIDVIAGEIKQTPEFFVKLSLEWFHRLITQPKRLKRMLVIPIFLLICIKKRLFPNL